MSINTFSINDSEINGGIAPIAISEDGISFDGFGLCNENYQIINSNWLDINGINVNSQAKPQTDGTYIYNQLIQDKSVNLEILVRGTSRTNVEQNIDTLKKSLYKEEGKFVVTISGEKRVAICTTTNFEVRNRDINKATCFVDFIIGDPAYFYKQDSTSKVYLNTTTDINGSVFNNGIYKTRARYYLLFKTGITSLSQIDIVLGGYTLTINETISDNDVLLIDSLNKLVKLNDVEIDYDGPIDLPFEVGNNPIQINFSGSSTFDTDITIIYNENYI